jgi:Helix-hairpin-helix motif
VTQQHPPARTSGAWYFGLTILSAGLLAAIPFWHAWSRLRTDKLRTLALAYTAVDVALIVLISLTPDRTANQSGNQTVSTIGGFAVIAVVVAACIQLRGIRHAVFAAPRAISIDADPVVARALAARQRRIEARKLWTSDPAMARELGVGRPDLGRGFDDGGLVDLNAASAPVMARVCGIDQRQAEAIVAARTARGGSYFNLGELFVDISLPESVQGALTEHAIV